MFFKFTRIMKYRNFSLFILILAISASCTHESTIEPIADEIDTICDPNKVYFVNDILPIMKSSCGYSGCHDVNSHEHGIILTSYDHIMASDVVDAGRPDNSELYEVLNDDGDDLMPPLPASPLTDDQISKIRNWILQGAKNNYCASSACDTATVTFSGSVWPIIENNCFGCHSGASPDGGISLSNYDDVKSVGQSGSLIGTISHASGYSAMPKNSTKLSDCEINTIKIWIRDGYQNN